MVLSIIIVGYNCCHDVENAIASIREYFIGLEYEIILVNNYAGDDKLPALIARLPDLIVIDNGTNPGFGAANNYGLAIAKGKYICFLNPDIIILNSIAPLISLMESDSAIGLVGPLLRNSDMTVQHSRHNLPSPKNWFSFCFSLNSLFPRVTFWGNYIGNDFPYRGDAESGWVSGSYMLTRRDLMEELNGFDPAFFMYNEDVDLCWRVQKAGYKVVFSDRSEAIHIGGVTSGNKSNFKAREMMKSYAILWEKHFSEKDVRRLLRVTYWSAKLKSLCWSAICAVRLSKKTNEKEYNTLMAEIARRQLSERRGNR